MKLVKNKKLDGSGGRCTATTNSGSRCSRDAFKRGYCKQHYRLAKERGLLVEASGDKKLTEVPPVPDEFGKIARRRWQVYGKYLVDRELLCQVHLYPLANLCYLEEQLEKTKKDIEDHGVVNHYESAIQRNGYASHFDKLLGHIRNLRADLGLTIEAPSGAAGGTAGSSVDQPQPKGYEGRKAKDW